MVSLLVGLLTGAFAAWAYLDSLEDELDTRAVQVRDYTPDELEIACLPFMRATATTLEQAQTRVSALEIRVRAKEAEIARLEQQAEATSAGTVDIVGRLEAARDQLDDLEVELETAREEKAQLLADLEHTREQLAGTRLKLAKASARVIEEREEKLDQQWNAFVGAAQLMICRTGSTERVDRCRQQVVEAMSLHKLRFKACVRSGQAVPEVRRASIDEPIPSSGVRLDPDLRMVRGWYVLFCDPALPEAPGVD